MLIRSVLLLCGLLMAGVGARAAPTLVLSGSTILGVDGVVVGATSYNPRFVDGTCATVYGACTNADFTFAGVNSSDTAAVASATSALRAALLSLSATTPSNYNGCTSGSLCELLTPWWLSNPTSVWTTSLYVQGGSVYGPDVNSSTNPATDQASNLARVYVQWTPLAQDAPEPASLTLMGVGLAAMSVLGRRRRRG